MLTLTDQQHLYQGHMGSQAVIKRLIHEHTEYRASSLNMETDLPQMRALFPALPIKVLKILISWLPGF